MLMRACLSSCGGYVSRRVRLSWGGWVCRREAHDIFYKQEVGRRGLNGAVWRGFEAQWVGLQIPLDPRAR